MGVFNDVTSAFIMPQGGTAFYLVAARRPRYDTLVHIVPLALATAVPGLLPPLVSAAQWQVVFERRRLRRHLPQLAPNVLSLASPVSSAIMLLLLLALVAPPLGYLLLDANTPRAFLFYWILFVGVSIFVVIVFSFAATISCVNWFDSQLPEPIFHDVASMIAAVEWDAGKHPGYQNPVQWLHIERNETGGLYLIGMHYTVRQSDENSTPPDTRIYVISTDLWASITNFEFELIDESYYHYHFHELNSIPNLGDSFLRRNPPYICQRNLS